MKGYEPKCGRNVWGSLSLWFLLLFWWSQRQVKRFTLFGKHKKIFLPSSKGMVTWHCKLRGIFLSSVAAWSLKIDTQDKNAPIRSQVNEHDIAIAKVKNYTNSNVTWLWLWATTNRRKHKTLWITGDFDCHADAAVWHGVHHPVASLRSTGCHHRVSATITCYLAMVVCNNKLMATNNACKSPVISTAMRVCSPNGAHLGLHLKPLDAAIGACTLSPRRPPWSTNLLKTHKTLPKHNF